jgi:hypothetical protein
MSTTYSPDAAAEKLKKLYNGKCQRNWLQPCEIYVRTSHEVINTLATSTTTHQGESITMTVPDKQIVQRIEVMRGGQNCTNCHRAPNK